MNTATDATITDRIAPSAYRRWECRCGEIPVLLATIDDDGRVNIKMRDRYWHCRGRVQTICPKCGREHVFEGESR